MAFAELEQLQEPEVNKQPSVYPPAFDLGMVEMKTGKVCDVERPGDSDTRPLFTEPGRILPWYNRIAISSH